MVLNKIKLATAIAHIPITNNPYSIVITTENQSFKITKHAIKSTIIQTNSVVLNMLNGLLILASNINPITTVDITHSVP